MTFSKFYRLNESRFRILPPSIKEEAVRLTEKYLKSIKQITLRTIGQFKKIGLRGEWKKYFEDEPRVWFVAELTTTTFIDLKTHEPAVATVYVAYGETEEDYATYDSENNILIIYDNVCRYVTKEKIESVMVHELTHGFQQHKEYSKRYQKSFKKDTKTVEFYSAYYTEPIEYDAFTTEISYAIKNKFYELIDHINHAERTETKTLLKKRLEKFLLELRVFTRAPLETYLVLDELPVPQVFETFTDALEHFKKKPKLWNSFKSKMNNLLDDLEKSLNEIEILASE